MKLALIWDLETSAVLKIGLLMFHSSDFGSVLDLSRIYTSYWACAGIGFTMMNFSACSLSTIELGIIRTCFVRCTKNLILSVTSLSTVVMHKTRSSGFNVLNLYMH